MNLDWTREISSINTPAKIAARLWVQAATSAMPPKKKQRPAMSNGRGVTYIAPQRIDRASPPKISGHSTIVPCISSATQSSVASTLEAKTASGYTAQGTFRDSNAGRLPDHEKQHSVRLRAWTTNYAMQNTHAAALFGQGPKEEAPGRQGTSIFSSQRSQKPRMKKLMLLLVVA